MAILCAHMYMQAYVGCRAADGDLEARVGVWHRIWRQDAVAVECWVEEEWNPDFIQAWVDAVCAATLLCCAHTALSRPTATGL